MREDVQVGAAAVEVVSVEDIARARGTNRATEAQKGAIFMVVGVGGGTKVSRGEFLLFELELSLVRTTPLSW